MIVWTSFLLAFTALLPLINPLGSTFVFLGLMGDVPAGVYRRIATKVALDNIIVLGTFEVLGSAILRFFGISLPIVQVGCGIVIASIGWSMLNERSAHASTTTRTEEAAACMDGHCSFGG